MKLEDIIKLKINNFEIKPPVKNEMIEPNPCQEGYEAIGLKEKDGRMVPNCVPIKDGMAVVKEGFPIPSPSGDEDEQAYISRCISSIIDEYGQEQASAICYTQWEKK
jgi:hypothetical protein